MDKILLAMDSRKFSADAVRFAGFLSRLTHSRLTGVFLEALSLREETLVIESGGSHLFETIAISEMEETGEELTLIENNLKRFHQIVREEGIQGQSRVDKGVPVLEIIAETRFSDILVVDPATSFSSNEESLPTQFVREILQEAECPVILAPKNFHGIDNIVFGYDGSKSAAFAMKQFTYLFPELQNKRAHVVDLKGSEAFSTQDQVAVREWLRYHYSDVVLEAVEDGSRKAFMDYLLAKKDDFIVLGTYGRGLVSSLYGQEGEDGAGNLGNMPVFVAHY